MRKILISLLLASAAGSPALAGPHNWSNQQQSQDDRQDAREARQQARAERPSFAPSARVAPQSPPRPQVIDRSQFSRPDAAQRQVDVNAMRAATDARRASLAGQRDQRIEQIQERVQQRQHDMRDARDLRQSTRPVPNVMRSRHPLVVSEVPRPGTQPPLRVEGRRAPQVQWNTGWRNNGRYDWRDYRRHHHSIFHLGFYYDPFGWGYSPYQIGWRMWPSYYSSQFWINDPWMYRLPYAPPGTQWIRYWNDALLVDMWSGEVIDAIPGFFW